MLGLVLLYVGAVLFINGLSMLGKIAPKDAAIMNLFAGGVSLFASLHQAASGHELSIGAAAFGLLFSFTYLWVAYGSLTGQDGRGLGWFSLFVAATAGLITIDQFQAAGTFSQYWIACCWAAWTVLWSCFFVIGALQRVTWTRPVAWMTIVQAIVTAWLPGYLMLSGHMAQ
ncbi:MAG: AmiS/UreI family transporter [Burkholderiales bacterium]